MVEADAARWRRLALAHALLRSERYAAHGMRHLLQVAAVRDQAPHTLLRILGLFSSSTPQLWLDTLPGAPAFRAQVELDGASSSAVAARLVSMGGAA